MRDGATVGGFHVFDTSQAAERFLKSGRMRALAANPWVSDLYVRIFSTLTPTGATFSDSAIAMQAADAAASDTLAAWQSEHNPTTAHAE